MPRLSSLALLALALLITACPGPAPGGDGGSPDATSDGGPPADGGLDGGGEDGGVDGGEDGGCPGCGECTPEATRCEGPRLATCDTLGRWLPAETCAGGLCRQDTCVAVSTCEAEQPACCALPEDCGLLEWRFTCAECRPVDAEADCLSGLCAARTLTTVDLTLRASARDLLPATRLAVRSGVMTLYRAESSDGRSVDCALIEGGAHDAQDPTLNVVHSRYLDYQAGTGNDLYDANIRGLPHEPALTVVLTVYDDYQGRGSALARACLAAVDLVDGGRVIVDLAELP
ncbi:MAG: hypothetical protein P1V51_12920 [Deltaproteobacteria bacterium]|nr:hypothetical protein [Deltaproteobacteria bacterium]